MNIENMEITANFAEITINNNHKTLDDYTLQIRDIDSFGIIEAKLIKKIMLTDSKDGVSVDIKELHKAYKLYEIIKDITNTKTGE